MELTGCRQCTCVWSPVVLKSEAVQGYVRHISAEIRCMGTVQCQHCRDTLSHNPVHDAGGMWPPTQGPAPQAEDARTFPLLAPALGPGLVAGPYPVSVSNMLSLTGREGSETLLL